MRLIASRNLTADEVERPDFSDSMKMIKEVSVTGKAVSPAKKNNKLSYPQAPIRSKICVPLSIQNTVAGVLYHDNRLLFSAFRETDLGILSYFSAIAAISIDNAQAYGEIKKLNKKLTQENNTLRRNN